MNIFKFIMPALAFLAVLFLVPGTSLAQVKVSGAVTAGFGQLSYDPGSNTSQTSGSDLRGEGRAYVDFKGGDGPVTIKMRYRIDEGAPGNISASRAQATWKVSDALSIDFLGSWFGLGSSFTAYGVNNVGHFGDGFTIGDMRADSAAFFLNASGINVNFKTGGMTLGVAILGECRPSCPETNTDDGIDEDSTFVLHFGGKFGNISVAAYNASSSGTNSMTADSSENSETELMFSMKTAAFAVGFEYSLGASNTGATDQKDLEKIGLSLGVDVGPIGARFTSVEYEYDGKVVDATSEIALAYTMKLNSKATFAIGYAVLTDDTPKDAGGADESLTYIIASMKSKF